MICQRSRSLRTNAHEWIEEVVFAFTVLMLVSLETLALEYFLKNLHTDSSYQQFLREHLPEINTYCNSPHREIYCHEKT